MPKVIRWSSLALIFAATLVGQQGQIGITTLATITGDAATHQLQTSGSARWVQFITASGNAAAMRIGSSNTSSTRGLPIAAGGGFMLPPIPKDSTESGGSQLYDLSKIYYYLATSDTVSVAWGN